MNSTSEFLNKINGRYGRMSKGHKRISAYITDHFDTAAFMTAAKLGETVGVSESTVVRYAISLGYKGYPELQEEVMGLVKEKLAEEHMDRQLYDMEGDVFANAIRSDIQKLNDTLNEMNPQTVEDAADSIMSADHVYIVGIHNCAPLAMYLGYYLKMIRGNVVVAGVDGSGELLEQLLRITENDTVIGIGFPRYSMRTLHALEFANDRNAKVVTVTDSVHSPMNLYSSCNLIAKCDPASMADSLTAPMSVIHALLLKLCAENKEAVVEALEAQEYVRENYLGTEMDEINDLDDSVRFGFGGRA